jgi:hypothetical protein
MSDETAIADTTTETEMAAPHRDSQHYNITFSTTALLAASQYDWQHEA